MKGKDFPTAGAQHVRVDLANVAEVVPAGHRLAVVVSHGNPRYLTGTGPWTPLVGVVADGGALASHVVLPVVNGTFGGAAPTLAYPPRPFLPQLGDE
jgi:hypothetical protein